MGNNRIGVSKRIKTKCKSKNKTIRKEKVKSMMKIPMKILIKKWKYLNQVKKKIIRMIHLMNYN